MKRDTNKRHGNLQRVSPEFERLVKEIMRQRIANGEDPNKVSFNKITKEIATTDSDLRDKILKKDKRMFEGIKMERRRMNGN
jgi:hypothetical protein